MSSLSQILEDELANSFEVKDKRSLHRYVSILTEKLAREDRNEREHAEFRENFLRIENRLDMVITEMKEGFKRMDERFESVNKRFESTDKRFESIDKRFESIDKRFEDMNIRFEDVNKRFEDINKRFSMMFTFMSLGFIMLATLISVYQFL